jgi:hypothetical protein
VSCPALTPLRFLKALLIFVTQKLNFLFPLFIVVDFLFQYGEKLKGEKYPFERILNAPLLKTSFVETTKQQNSMKLGGGGGVFEFTLVVKVTKYFLRPPFESHLSLQWLYAARCRM